MATKNIDIHNYEKRVTSAVESIRRSDLSFENKQSLEKFRDALRLENISAPRIAKYLGTMRIVALAVGKEFRSATKEDLEQFVLSIKARDDLSVWTKRDYAVTIRKFYSWLQGDGKRPPEKVSCITTTLRKRDQPRIKKAELLTEADVAEVLRVAKNVRDAALVSMLWDTGARIGELGSMRIGDITFEETHMLLDLRGKTGQRTVLACESTRALQVWLESHPGRGDPSAPLWVSMYSEHQGLAPMGYGALSTVVKTMFRRSGVRKRFNPHLFRHSRATWCVEHDWSTYELCRHFGWELDSGMPSVYLSLSDKFVHDKMLKTYGLAPSREEVKSLKCARCATLLTHGRSFCPVCGLSTTRRPAYEERLQAERLSDQVAAASRDPVKCKVMLDAANRFSPPQSEAYGIEGVHPGSALPPLPPVPGRSGAIQEGAPGPAARS